jgi:uncharacterized protein
LAKVVTQPQSLPAELAAAEVNGHPSAWLEARLTMEGRRIRMTPDGPQRDAPMEMIKLAMRLGLKMAGLWQRGLANGLDIQYRLVELTLPRLPREFDDYRILQISDPHFDSAPALGDAILRAVAGAEVDLCVLTGDYRIHERGAFTQTAILEPISALRQKVRTTDGFLAILGNHDSAAMVEPFERIGLRVLINQRHQLRRGRQTVVVTGLDDVHRYYTPAANAALAAHDPSTCGIVLAHSPEVAGEAAASGHALYLCGHCHGGQICLPGGRPVITHLSRHRNLHTGLWRHGDMWGYTSTGAGLSDPPVRFNCRGEVTEFRLRTMLTPLS